MKHGLLAKILTPPKDIRDHDQLYRFIHQQLVDELNPVTFTQRYAVNLLAHEFLLRARVTEMIEALQCPAGLSATDVSAWDQLRIDRRELKSMRGIISSIDAGKPLDCSPEVATTIAGRVGEYVESFEADVTPTPDSVPVEEMDEAEQKEDRLLKELWDRLSPHKKELTDRSRLASVLTGSEQMTNEALLQLRDVISRLAESAKTRVKLSDSVIMRVEATRRAQVANLAIEPDKLMLLGRYANSLERSIKRKLAELR